MQNTIASNTTINNSNLTNVFFFNVSPSTPSKWVFNTITKYNATYARVIIKNPIKNSNNVWINGSVNI